MYQLSAVIKILNIFLFIILGLSYLSPNIFSIWPNAIQDFFAISFLILLFFLKPISKFKVYLLAYLFLFSVLIIPFFQYYLLHIIYFKETLILVVFYLFIFFSSIIFGLNYDNWYIDKYFWAGSFIIYGIVSVFLQLYQIYFVSDSIWILKNDSLRPFANIGQPNQLATLLIISNIFSIFLYTLKKLKFSIFFLINFILLYGVALTQSRTAWLSLAIITILAIFKKKSKLSKIFIVNFVTYLILIYVSVFFNRYSIFWIESSNPVRTFYDAARPYIWQQIIKGCLEFPLQGVGWGQTSVAQTYGSLTYPNIIIAEYAHNIILDLMAWNGLPLGSIIVLCLFLYSVKVYLIINDKENFILFSIIFAFIIHSLLEFPFAYAYFLIPVGIILGVLHANLFKDYYSYIGGKKVSVILLGILLFFLVLISVDYLKIKKMISKYSYQSFSNKSIEPVTDKIYVLDKLAMQTNINYLDGCKVIDLYSYDDIFHLTYLFPNRKNISILYQSTVYNSINDKSIENLMESIYGQNYKKSLNYYYKNAKACQSKS
nr:Wzy polymerase domain-containing protein [Moraxella osloensis]